MEAFSLPGLPQRATALQRDALSEALATLPADRVEGAPEPLAGAYQVLAQLAPDEA